jgi:hypothetical protein
VFTTTDTEIRPVYGEVQVGAIHPLKISLHPLGICKIYKINMLITTLKNV